MNEETESLTLRSKIEKNVFWMAEVEIIIPFHGEHTKVTKLVEAIFNTVYSNKYLITLVDDASVNKSFVRQLQNAKIPGLRCFRLEEQKGFGAAVNHALKNPWRFPYEPNKKIKYVCILHSDSCPEDNYWLFEMGNSLEKLRLDGIKMVGSVTNNSTTNFKNLTKEKGSKKEDYILQQDEYLPMYSCLCNRELFNRIGLLKEFPYAGTEAREFAHRMKENNYLQAVCGKSWMFHEGKGTLKNLEKNKRIQKILRNAELEFEESIKKEEPSNINTTDSNSIIQEEIKYEM
ncbi:MAG: glycosyltransferase [Neisseriaceae bacterium]|nr:MAG: glycosyltransferase [Neisseriaceae bacterium]